MIYYTVKKPRILSLALLDEALIFATEFLDIDPSLEIDFSEEFNGNCGFCDIDEEDNIIVSINPRMTIKEIVATLFHELVHAKQYIKGELVNRDGKPSKWRGKIFQNHFSIPYIDLPWEKEAYLLEEKMMDIFYSKSRKTE